MTRDLALGRLKTGSMNKTERAYADRLTLQQQAGQVAWFRFEGVKLRLADGAFYSPDFAVMMSDGFLEMHEIKGHWRDDARVKIKVAAEMYPFRFLAVTRSRAGWDVEEFS